MFRKLYTAIIVALLFAAGYLVPDAEEDPFYVLTITERK